MKKIVCIATVILITIILVACCTTCTNTTEASGNSMFIEVEKTLNWRVVYHKKTKVMYSVSRDGGHNYGGGVFTLLVTPDGSPMLYEEE